MNNRASILTNNDLEQVVGGGITNVSNGPKIFTTNQAPSASVGEMQSLQVGTPVSRT